MTCRSAVRFAALPPGQFGCSSRRSLSGGRNGRARARSCRHPGEPKPVGGLHPLVAGSVTYHSARAIDSACVAQVDMVESEPIERRAGGGVDKVQAALTAVGAHDVAHEPFGHLSEGQKQRLMARALVSDLDVLVLDELTSAMDPLAEQTIYELINCIPERCSLSHCEPLLAVFPAIATCVYSTVTIRWCCRAPVRTS